MAEAGRRVPARAALGGVIDEACRPGLPRQGDPQRGRQPDIRLQTRTWIDTSRLKFVWAAIVVGCVGVIGAIFYDLYNVEDSPCIWPSDEYFGIIATSIIIGIMLGLLTLSVFEPNDSVR